MINCKIIYPGEKLSPEQRLQISGVIAEGFSDKFKYMFKGNEDKIPEIIEFMLDKGVLPGEEMIYAVDSISGDILGVALINSFKGTKITSLIKLVGKAFEMIGIVKGIRALMGFYIIDVENNRINDKSYIAELYLCSVRSEYRGRGIGTELLRATLCYVKEKQRAYQKSKFKLVVFGKNPACSLYEREGFTTVKRYGTPRLARLLGQDYDELVLMERGL